jgi:hypothetical protein
VLNAELHLCLLASEAAAPRNSCVLCCVVPYDSQKRAKFLDEGDHADESCSLSRFFFDFTVANVNEAGRTRQLRAHVEVALAYSVRTGAASRGDGRHILRLVTDGTDRTAGCARRDLGTGWREEFGGASREQESL